MAAHTVRAKFAHKSRRIKSLYVVAIIASRRGGDKMTTTWKSGDKKSRAKFADNPSDTTLSLVRPKLVARACLAELSRPNAGPYLAP